MSIIAWDGTSMSADSQMVVGSMRAPCKKITKSLVDLPRIIGWVGQQDHGLTLLDWYLTGENPKTYPAFQATPDFTRLIVWQRMSMPVVYEQTPHPILVEAPFMAWGSGRDFAMGAMAHGATAERAIEIACRFDICCGGDVVTHDFFVESGK